MPRWWGTQPNIPACRSRVAAKPSRIDGILTNVQATALIHSFEVEKHEIVPIHSFLRIKISRGAMRRKRVYARTLPSPKKMFDGQVAQSAEGKEETEKWLFKNEEKDKLQEIITKQFEMRKANLDIYREANDTDGFWKTWCDAVKEDTCNILMKVRGYKKSLRGRGTVTILEKILDRKETVMKAEDTMRSEWSTRAL